MRLRTCLVSGIRDGVSVACVEIYPPSSVANATASPRGEAFFTPCIHTKHNFMWQNHNTSIFRPVTLLCSAKGVLQKGFPSGGSCRVQRLMRGDKSALPIGMYLSPETERHMGRSTFRSLTNLNHFYPVAGARRKPTKSRSTGFCAGAAGIRSTEYGDIQSLHNKKEDQKSPCSEGLEGS